MSGLTVEEVQIRLISRCFDNATDVSNCAVLLKEIRFKYKF